MRSGSTGSARATVDTNVLVYAADRDAEDKHHTAVDLLQELVADRRLVLSVQVLNELYSVVTRRRRSIDMSHSQAIELVRRLAAAAEVVPLTPSTTLRALDAVAAHGFSWWDALIWAAPKEHSVSTIYSEDAQSASEIDGIRYVNPFALRAVDEA